MYCSERALLSPSQWDSENLYDKPNAGVPLFIKAVMVNNAITKMKPGKPAGPSGIVAELLKSSGNSGTKLIAGLINVNTGKFHQTGKVATSLNSTKVKGTR